LHLLNALAVRHGWKLAEAHFNHRLRGKSSDADESLVRKTAKRLGLRFVSATGEVKKFAMAGGLSVEMAARKLRHEFLAKAAARLKIRKVAFAHHADDQVELFFLRLLRGSGGEGLAGMKWRSRSPVDAGIELIRPLLNEHKTWLRAYALDGGIAFREDGSNDSLDIQRNRIRHELLPLLREKYQPALDRTILRAAELIRGDAEHAAVVAREWLEVFRSGRAGQRFGQLPVAVQRQAIYIQMLELGIVPDFESVEKLRCEPDIPIGLGGAGVRVKRDEAASMAQWRAIANLDTLPGGDATILRLSVAPSKGPALLVDIRHLGGRPVLLDQGGALIFVTLPPGLTVAQAALAAARSAGGHAMLLRGDAEIRDGLSWFGRRDGPQAALTERVRKSFDPAGILNPGFAGA